MLITVNVSSGCFSGNSQGIPKPRAFPKVDFPVKDWVLFKDNSCPFVFERPTYTAIEKKTKRFEEDSENPCWFDLYYPDFECRIHFSYYSISDKVPFQKLSEDAFRLAMEHNRKASFIDEFPISRPQSVYGFLFNIEGPAATPFQFYLTDSTDHFLRGALYFETRIRPDSLQPQYEFVKRDIVHIIDSFQWN